MADSLSLIPSGATSVGQQVGDYIKSSSASNTSQSGGSANINEIIQDTLQHGIPGGGDMGGMIQNRPQVMLPQPIRPKQIPMGHPVGNVNATTAGGQKRNDINNLISGVSNIVKGAVNKKREKEDQALMSDLAIIEAASSNPNDPHNKAIIQSIGDDPKRTKRLEKALGYNPLSGEPPPPEAQTLAKYGAQSQQKKQQKTAMLTQMIQQKLGPQAAQQGGGQSQGGAPQVPGQQQQGGAMDNLMSRMPNTAQLSPIVQVQAELIKAGILPKADTQLSAVKDLMKEAMTNDAKYAEISARLEASNNASLMRFKAVLDQSRTRYATEVLKQTNENSRAELKSKDYNARTNMQKDKLEKQYGTQKAANLIATLGSLDKDIASTQKEIDQTAARGSAYKGDVDKLYQKLHAKQNEKDTMEGVLGLKDPDMSKSGIGQGVNLLDLPASSQDMDSEDLDGWPN